VSAYSHDWLQRQIYLGRWLTLAIGVLSVAFGFAGTSLVYVAKSPLSIYSGYLAGAVVGFLAHEVAHREVARRQGCLAGFVLTPLGLLLTLFSGILRSIGVGFAILAPGYVAIYCYGGWRSGGPVREDLIAAAGPAVNIVLAAAALAAQSLAYGFAAGFREINAWLALFNLLPLHPLDGAKVMRSNVMLWLVLLLAAVLLL